MHLDLQQQLAKLNVMHVRELSLRRVFRTPMGWLVGLVAAQTAFSDQAPIGIDSVYNDWAGVPVAYVDSAGDGNGIDLGRLWIADDDRFLFLRYETGIETDPSENQDIRIYLDTDANSGTGLSIGGIGAELEWRTGIREGTFYVGGSTTVHHEDIRFRGAATVTATQFEVAFGRDTLPDGSNRLFSGSQVGVLIWDADGGDQLPNNGDTVTYTLDVGSVPPVSPIALGREQATDLRVITYNIHTDDLWDANLQDDFGRMITAVAPDVLNFQEINNHTGDETAALVESWLPSGAGESWYWADRNDCQTISRYPVIDSWGIDGNLATLLDTTAVIGKQLLVFSAHPPCCTNDSGRQAEIDNFMSFIRDAKQPGGVLTLDPNTAIIISGDMNLVGLSRQLTTLVTGDIDDEATYGPDFNPDWDGTALTNLISRQTEKRMAYTWRNDSSSFWPGHLDYIVYSDAVIEVGNHFILYTPEMSAASLATYGLQNADSLASAHLLFCADFRPSTAPCPGADGDMNDSGATDGDDIGIFTDRIINGGATPDEECAGDFDGMNGLDIGDVTGLVTALLTP